MCSRDYHSPHLVYTAHSSPQLTSSIKNVFFHFLHAKAVNPRGKSAVKRGYSYGVSIHLGEVYWCGEHILVSIPEQEIYRWAGHVRSKYSWSMVAVPILKKARWQCSCFFRWQIIAHPSSQDTSFSPMKVWCLKCKLQLFHWEMERFKLVILLCL